MLAVNGVGKPCAGEPHARIDGRELETEQRAGHGRGEERSGRNPRITEGFATYRLARATAPAPDPPLGSAGEDEDLDGVDERGGAGRAAADPAQDLPAL